jgi:ABC-type protease/lipase transport system fused ATPase/permease subunit
MTVSATNGNAARNPLSLAMRACIPGAVAAVIISMFITATMLAMPIYSMQIYDRVLSSRLSRRRHCATARSCAISAA